MAYLNFPPVRTYSDEPVAPGRVSCRQGALWLDALDYADLGFAAPRPQDNLGYDGMWRGGSRGPRLCQRQRGRPGFWRRARRLGRSISSTWTSPWRMRSCWCATAPAGPAAFTLAGWRDRASWHLPGQRGFQPWRRSPAGRSGGRRACPAVDLAGAARRSSWMALYWLREAGAGAGSALSRWPGSRPADRAGPACRTA